jgi:hypothetical protein
MYREGLKKMRKTIFIVFVVIAGLIVLFYLNWLCRSGRYQIAFGNIQKESEHILWTGSELKDSQDKSIIPVCFKIDTFTGEVWMYMDYKEYHTFVDNPNKDYTDTELGFSKIVNEFGRHTYASE